MTNQRANHIKKLYGILLSLVLIVAGICLIAECCAIYFTDDGSFSREIVADHFSGIAIPVYLCLAMIILGFVLDFILPAGRNKSDIQKNYSLILQQLHRKTDLNACDEAVQKAVAREQKSRKYNKLISIVLLVLGSILFLAYGANGNNYDPREITDSLIRAMYLLIPAIAVPFGYALFSAYYCRASMLREIDLLKQVGSNRSPAPCVPVKSRKADGIVRWAVLVVAVSILVYGYIAGGTADVLTKAINICTECVGLG